MQTHAKDAITHSSTQANTNNKCLNEQTNANGGLNEQTSTDEANTLLK